MREINFLELAEGLGIEVFTLSFTKEEMLFLKRWIEYAEVTSTLSAIDDKIINDLKNKIKTIKCKE